MNKFKEAAIKILKESSEPLSTNEITRKSIESGILETSAKSPEKSMAAVITVDIKLNGNGATFIKVDKGLYSLNKHKSNVDKAKKELAKISKQEKLESGYTGRGGEYLVCSELLFRGFNASIMTVDDGLDIVATKDHIMFGIQVKTSNVNLAKSYIFDIRKASFAKHNTGNIFYVLVLKDETHSDFVVLPTYEIERLIAQNSISSINNHTKYRIVLRLKNGSVYITNEERPLDHFLNNWSLIR